jgi:hypothetical protein
VLTWNNGRWTDALRADLKAEDMGAKDKRMRWRLYMRMVRVRGSEDSKSECMTLSYVATRCWVVVWSVACSAVLRFRRDSSTCLG